MSSGNFIQNELLPLNEVVLWICERQWGITVAENSRMCVNSELMPFRIGVQWEMSSVFVSSENCWDVLWSLITTWKGDTDFNLPDVWEDSFKEEEQLSSSYSRGPRIWFFLQSPIALKMNHWFFSSFLSLMLELLHIQLNCWIIQFIFIWMVY